jgi:hypothetical protein
MEQEHSDHYILELQLKDDKKKWYAFTQGISPLFYRIEQGVQHFRIYKKWISDTKWKQKDLTWRFSQFQQLYRKRLQLKKLIWKNLRLLETGEVTFQQLSNRLK